MKKYINIIILVMIMTISLAWAQANITHPVAKELPSSYDFNIPHNSTVYPNGIVGWKIGTNCTQEYKVCPPIENRALTASRKASNYGNGIYNYDKKIGMLNSQSHDMSIAFAVDTRDKSNIRVTYDMMTMRSPALRSNRAVLQYRIGDESPFTTLYESEYISSETRHVSGTEPIKVQTISVILPEECNDQELVQLRFVSRDESIGDEHRSSFAVNNISVKENDEAYITLVPNSLSNITYNLDEGPSSPQIIGLSASSLTDNINLQVQGDFEISLDENGSYGNAITINQSSGSIDETFIYLRLKGGLERGSYTGRIVSYHESIAYPTEIYLSGSVEEPLGPGDLIDFEGENETQDDVQGDVLKTGGEISLSNIMWFMKKAEIGNHLVNDYKDGLRSLRLSGKLDTSFAMLDDKKNGIGTLHFSYSRYIEQPQLDWKVQYSRDRGATWIQIGDEFTALADDTVQIFHEKVNVPGDVRIRIVRGSGSQDGATSVGHLNIDNIFLSHYDGYDIYPADKENIGESSSAKITGADFLGANFIFAAPESLTPFPNTEFIPETRGKWELFGEGYATITLTTDNDWFAWVEDGLWNTLAGPFDDESIEILISENSAMFEFMTGNGTNPTLPAELSSFTVALNDKDKPVITWTTQSENAVNGFYIYRGTNKDLNEATLISSLIPATNSSLAHSYSYIDTGLYEAGVYYYWLNVSDLNGHESYHGPVKQSLVFEEGSTPEMVYQTGLNSIYPNPFNPSTNIAFELAEDSEVKISVYNTRGQIVRSFAPFSHNAGYGSIVWDGKDENGAQLSTGMYLFRMSIGGKNYITKALMLK